MEQSKVGFFIIRTFDDLVFTKDDLSGCQDQDIRVMFERITPHRARIKFEKEFGGDGTEASVIYGASTYSTRGKNGYYDPTFEVMYSDEDEPRGYETKEQINAEFLRRSLNKTLIEL
jgi:hypothetical protein